MAASCLHIAAIILSCFMLLNGVTDAVLSMDETCIYYTEGYIADPSSCADWGYCRGGQVIAKGSCTSGYQYDSATGSCADPKSVNCAFNATTMCDGEIAAYKSDPNSCSSYCYCQNNANIGCQSCNTQPGDDLFYNPNINECTYPSQYNCPIDSACRLVPNNKFVADSDPAKCGNYLRCVNGASTSAPCSNGLLYNPANGLCDTYTSLNCSATSAPDQTLTSTQINAQCAPYTGVAGAPQFFGDTLTCGGYIACTATNVGNRQTCPWGLHFDIATQQCVSPLSTNCQYDRCNNLNLDFVTAVTVPATQCKSYVNCKGSKATSPLTGTPCASVSSVYTYYDEVAGGCVEDKPDYPICA